MRHFEAGALEAALDVEALVRFAAIEDALETVSGIYGMPSTELKTVQGICLTL